jgi:hypothetical protein
MLKNFIDGLKDSTGIALRMMSLIAAVAILLFITLSFLCAAAFVFVLQRSGLVFACLTGAGIFFVITLITAGCYLYAKRQSNRRPAEAAKSAFATAMSDPMMLATGLQIVSAVGVKRMLPLLAVGAIAFGLMAQQKSPADNPAE